MNKKTVVVTGGAGFLGGHLFYHFIWEGVRVFCVDNLITGSTRNIEHLKKNPNFWFIRHDISKEFRLNDPVDYVLHFASPARPVDYLNFPIPTLKVGVL